jgi:hypothetical protein
MVNKNPKEKQHVKLDSHIEIIPLSLGGIETSEQNTYGRKLIANQKVRTPYKCEYLQNFPYFDAESS